MELAACTTLVVVAVTAAASDITSRRVSNRLNLMILALGLGWRTSIGGIGMAALGIAGAIAGIAMLWPLFAARWLGGGDVKLLAALGAWLGPTATGVACLLGLAGGGVLAAAFALAGGAALRREVASHVAASVLTMTTPRAPRRAARLTVPLAVPLAGAAVAVFFVRGGF